MLRTANGWRVYDVVIEGVSLVSNYRMQFDRIIETASYDELARACARARWARAAAPAARRGQRLQGGLRAPPNPPMLAPRLRVLGNRESSGLTAGEARC